MTSTWAVLGVVGVMFGVACTGLYLVLDYREYHPTPPTKEERIRAEVEQVLSEQRNRPPPLPEVPPMRLGDHSSTR
jgi:hypothetical protein